MKLSDLKKSFTSLTFIEQTDLIKERRASRYESKKKPKTVKKKIEKKNQIIDLISMLSKEEAEKLLKKLEG